jgi:putative glycosyltransferase (TIGR04372 family)
MSDKTGELAIQVENILHQYGLNSQMDAVCLRNQTAGELWQSEWRARRYAAYCKAIANNNNDIQFFSYEEFLNTLVTLDAPDLRKVRYVTIYKLIFKKIITTIGRWIYQFKRKLLARIFIKKTIIEILQLLEDGNYKEAKLASNRSISDSISLKLIRCICERLLNINNITSEEAEHVVSLSLYMSALLIKKDVVLASSLFSHSLKLSAKLSEEKFKSIEEIVAGIISSLFLAGKKEYYVSLGAAHMEEMKRRAKNQGIDFSQKVYLNRIYPTTIGYIANMGMFAKLQNLIKPHSKGILLLDLSKVANPTLLRYMEPFFDFVTQLDQIKKFEQFIDCKPLVTVVEVDAEWIDYYDAFEKIEDKWQAQENKPLLKLTEEDLNFGWENLEKIGIPPNAKFVCAHVRESGFYRKTEGSSGNHFNAERNADIMTYLQTFKEIVKQGYHVIRIGDPTMKPLPSMEGVFDYANSKLKSDRMDVFLMGACKWFISTNSGPFAVPGLFGVPSLHTNFLPIGNNIGYRKDMLLPRLLRHKRTKQFFSFNQVMSSYLGHVQSVSHVSDDRIEYISNTEDEIFEAAKEMMKMIEGGQDQKLSPLQIKFRDLCALNNFRVTPIIPDSFLRKWEKLVQ